ncbi:MAG: cation transporting ATPase C-terminal domain-containing protein, partial [Longicatena sp.]
PILRVGLFSNKYSIYAFLVGFALLNAILLMPFLHGLFSVTTITMEQLFTIYGLAFIPTIFIQIGKYIRKRK